MLEKGEEVGDWILQQPKDEGWKQRREYDSILQLVEIFSKNMAPSLESKALVPYTVHTSLLNFLVKRL